LSAEVRGSAVAAQLPAPLRAARIAEGGAAGVLRRLLERREGAAREEGLRAGRAEALRGAAGALDQAAARLDEARELAEARLAHTAAQLAVEVARVLLRREVRAGHYDLEAMVREALAASGVSRGRCVVHLHPADAAQLVAVPFRAGTELEPDEGVARGCVHVTTAHGLLVRDLDEAVGAIAERLQQELE
jgi:flagellar biosynthesis/type III secretory pathway protein FliH